MKYTIVGRVHPERADIFFDRIELNGPKDASVVVRCDSSQLVAVVQHPDVDGWRTAQLLAEDAAMIVVSSLGFSLGCGYTIEILQTIDEEGNSQVTSVKPDGKAQEEHLGFEDHVIEFNRAFRLAAKNIFFRLALRDYTRALTESRDCATYCYRAIEAIKTAISTETSIKAWNLFHKEMNTSKDEIDQVVKVFADPVRHGNWIESKSTDRWQRWEMLRLTRNILYRYLDLTSKPNNGFNSDAGKARAG